jgi:glycosyltransferase involved in cell wall biosynthesis
MALLKAQEIVNVSKTAKVSIIMPAYNVENEILETVNMIKKAMNMITEDYEIIVVDDGSKDSTGQKLKALRDEHLKVISHPTNLGKGAAIKTGVKHATGEYTILLDADRDIDAKNIKQYIEALKEYDIVVASKRHPNSTYRAPTVRKMLSIAYNTLVKMLLGIKVGDTQTGFKAFKTKHLKTIMKVIVVKRYSWDAEALAVANMIKLKIAEAPVHIRQEKLFKFNNVLRMLMEVLGIAYRLRVIRWYQKNIEKENPQYKLILKI